MKGFIEVIDEDSGTLLLNTQKIVFVCESTIMCTTEEHKVFVVHAIESYKTIKAKISEATR